MNKNEVYNINTDVWETLVPMISKRGGLAAAAIGEKIFVFGGETRRSTFDNNEEFNTLENTWTSREAMPTSRHGLAAISYNASIFVIGGGTEPGFSMSGINEMFSPLEFTNILVSEELIVNQNQVKEEIPDEPVKEEIQDPLDSCSLIDRCLSPSEQTSSRIIYYIFLAVIGILLILITMTLISLYKNTKLN